MKTVLYAFLLASVLPAVSNAAGKPAKAPKEFSREDREKMAKAHESMAACLRSDKTLDACHEEMRKSCDDSGCPMMGHHMGKGMMKGHHGKCPEHEAQED